MGTPVIWAPPGSKSLVKWVPPRPHFTRGMDPLQGNGAPLAIALMLRVQCDGGGGGRKGKGVLGIQSKGNLISELSCISMQR